MKIVLLGAPGSGKGTASEVLKHHFSIPHISTGDIFRAAMAKETELGLLAKSFIDFGNLVPDDVTIKLVEERILEDDCKNGFILDGFPRTVAQAEKLTEIIDLDMVIYFDVDMDIALKRLLSRRVCSQCGAIYNALYYDKSTCNECGGQLFIRKDDNEETIRQRFEVFNKVTYPVYLYYKELGILREYDANDVAEVSRKTILKVVED